MFSGFAESSHFRKTPQADLPTNHSSNFNAALQLNSSGGTQTHTHMKRRPAFIERHCDEYGLQVASRNADGVVESVMCRFCIAFGREQSGDSTADDGNDDQDLNQDLAYLSADHAPARKRKKTLNVKYFSSFRNDNYKIHLQRQHPQRWCEYQASSKNEMQAFFGSEMVAPTLVALHTPTAPSTAATSSTDANSSSASSLTSPRRTSVPGASSSASHLTDTTASARICTAGTTHRSAGQHCEPTLSPHARRVYVVDAAIVDDIVHGMLSAAARSNVVSIFEKNPQEDGDNSSSSSYLVQIESIPLFQLCCNVVACGAPLPLISQLLLVQAATLQTLGAVPHSGDDREERTPSANAQAYVCAVVAINLQNLSDLMESSWTYALELQHVAQEQPSSPYLDVRIKFFRESDVHDYHVVALPAFQHRTGEHIYKMVQRVLNVLDTHWKKKLVGVVISGDEVAPPSTNLVGEEGGAVTLLQKEMQPGFIRVCSAVKQLDAALQTAIGQFANGNGFYSNLVALTGYLRRQDALISAMKTRCPTLQDTHWNAIGRVCRWILENSLPVGDYLDAQQPACAPSSEWWIHLSVLVEVMDPAQLVVESLRCLSPSLRSQPSERLEKLVLQLGEMCYVEQSLFAPTAESSDVMELIVGDYMMSVVNTLRFIQDRGSSVSEKLDNLDVHQQIQVAKSVAHFVLRLMDGIQRIHGQRDQSDHAMDVKLPPVLPSQWTKATTSELVGFLRLHRERILASKDRGFIQRVEEDHKRLLTAYRNEESLRDVINKHNPRASFREAWASVAGRFSHLMLFSGGLATLLPGISLRGSDTSSVCPTHSKSSSNRADQLDLDLEGILHCKQFDSLSKLE